MLEMFSFREVAKPQQGIKMQEQKAEKYFEKVFDGSKIESGRSAIRFDSQDAEKANEVHDAKISEKQAECYFLEKFDKKEIHYVSYEERLNHTPSETSERGGWKGERGESEYIPSINNDEGKRVAASLQRCGETSIKYRDAEPDFACVSEATVKIDRMTANRPDNFYQADAKCAILWNEIERDGRTNWTASDVRDFRRENELSWHERCDRKSMDLVPQNIHAFFSHSGGVAECRAYDMKYDMENKGGIFDD